MSDPFSQSAHRVRLDWGRAGAREAAARRDIIVVVDVLRFSTAVATALHYGVAVYPCEWGIDPANHAARYGAQVGRQGARYSLSPLSFIDAPPNTRVVLNSPNGATCVQYARDVPVVMAAALVNASAVGRAVRQMMQRGSSGVTVIACGERWKEANEDGELRFAIEDYLGAGAILAQLSEGLSPEAWLCRAAFMACNDRLPQLIRDCGSGRELIETDRGADVDHAARLDLYACVPVLKEEKFSEWAGESIG